MLLGDHGLIEIFCTTLLFPPQNTYSNNCFNVYNRIPIPMYILVASILSIVDEPVNASKQASSQSCFFKLSSSSVSIFFHLSISDRVQFPGLAASCCNFHCCPTPPAAAAPRLPPPPLLSLPPSLSSPPSANNKVNDVFYSIYLLLFSRLLLFYLLLFLLLLHLCSKC